MFQAALGWETGSGLSFYLKPLLISWGGGCCGGGGEGGGGAGEG